jgi:hypothetical protein
MLESARPAVLEQVGNDAVVTGSGSLNLAALTQIGTIAGAGPILILGIRIPGGDGSGGTRCL